MKPNIILALFQLFIISSSFTQTGVSRVTPGTTRVWDGKISGKVIENDSRTAIEFANIGLYHSGVEVPMDGTVSDGQGNFKFKNLKPGMYMVEVTFLGFETKSIDSLEITEKKNFSFCRNGNALSEKQDADGSDCDGREGTDRDKN